MMDKVAGQRCDQFFVGCGIGGANVVYRVDDAASHEIAPHAVDERAREERILRAGEPVGEYDAAVDGGIERNGFSVERRRIERPQQARVPYVPPAFGADIDYAPLPLACFAFG